MEVAEWLEPGLHSVNTAVWEDCNLRAAGLYCIHNVFFAWVT